MDYSYLLLGQKKRGLFVGRVIHLNCEVILAKSSGGCVRIDGWLAPYDLFTGSKSIVITSRRGEILLEIEGTDEAFRDRWVSEAIKRVERGDC